MLEAIDRELDSVIASGVVEPSTLRLLHPELLSTNRMGQIEFVLIFAN